MIINHFPGTSPLILTFFSLVVKIMNNRGGKAPCPGGYVIPAFLLRCQTNFQGIPRVGAGHTQFSSLASDIKPTLSKTNTPIKWDKTSSLLTKRTSQYSTPQTSLSKLRLVRL